MTSAAIRQQYLDFFKSKGHTIVRSASVVPGDDPTLLFTNAGMNQFKDVFVGKGTRPYKRAVDSQKCIRVSGKHNDLEEVGRDGRHHTFFEMLGNWSFGDYYKKEAIHWGWEFLTRTMELDPDRLWVTVYKDDDEAYTIWADDVKVPAERIIRLGDIEQGDDENFWSMGDTGPCGPCTEIHYDQGDALTCGDNCGIGKCDCDRYLELWNLVFMQYNKRDDGVMEDLPMRSVDTGLGLERLVAVKQNVFSNYDTDLFQTVIKALEELCGKKYEDPEHKDSFRIIADHLRALSFAIADQCVPTNEGRGYVLRRILRRGLRHGKLLGLNKPFMYRLVDALESVMGTAYPELTEKKEVVKKIIRAEEEKFSETIDSGIANFEQIAAEVSGKGEKVIPGAAAFKLYDTFGFPVDLTQVMAEEKGMTVDLAGFETAMDGQRALARKAAEAKAGGAVDLGEWKVTGEGAGGTFLGYETLEAEGTIIRFRRKDGKAEVVLDKTPFYAESGGQVGDTGVIRADGLEITVTGVIKEGDTIVHRGTVTTGTLSGGETVTAVVNAGPRADTQRNHTATHILHRALKTVLGDHVNQAGSMVSPERLRFDFNHFSAVTDEEKEKIEEMANRTVLENREVSIRVTGIDEAKAEGATALFGEKYGDEVRVVTIDGYSKELCGGTHVSRSGDIGRIKIVSESSVASGIRRIEALTGMAAWQYEKKLETTLLGVARQLDAGLGDVEEKVERLQKQVKQLQKELKEGGAKGFDADALLKAAVQKEGFKIASGVVECRNPGDLRTFGDTVRDKIGSGVAVLAARLNGKVSVCAVVTKDLTEKGVHAGKIIKEVAGMMGGKGGGQAHYAQGGGQDESKLEDALNAVENIVAGQL